MKPFAAACLYLLVLATAFADPSEFKPVDGWIRKGPFIDVDPKINKRLRGRYEAMADRGVELGLTQGAKVIGRAYVEPLGVGHSAYSQAVGVEINSPSTDDISIISVAPRRNDLGDTLSQNWQTSVETSEKRSDMAVRAMMESTGCHAPSAFFIRRPA